MSGAPRVIAEIDLTLSDDEDLALALQASLDDAPEPFTIHNSTQQQGCINAANLQPPAAHQHAAQPSATNAGKAPVVAQQCIAPRPPRGAAPRASAGRQQASTFAASDDDDNDDDHLDFSFLCNTSQPLPGNLQGASSQHAAPGAKEPPLQGRYSGSGPHTHANGSQPRGVNIGSQNTNAGHAGDSVDDLTKQQIRQQSDQDITRPAAARRPSQDVLPKEEWAAAAEQAGEMEAQQAQRDGCTSREIKRRQKAAASATLSRLRAASKEYERQMKLQAKEDEKQAKAQAKLAKKEAVAQLKASARENKQVNKALSGGPVDPSKFMVLRLSVRMMEVPWVAALLSRLQEEKYEYKVDADMPLSSKYAFVRWTRRVPRAAAAAMLQMQQQDDQGGPPSLQLFHGGQQQQQDVDLVFPLLCVFLPPEELISTCTPPAPPGGSMAGPSSSQRQQYAPPFMALQGLRSAVQDAYPHATLMLACVGLTRQLTVMERAPGSVFNSQAVRDQLLDLQLMYPALRFREDLVDGPQAAEWLVTTSKCLGNHHRKQQEGYLNSFNLSRVRADLLEGLPHGARTMAVALGHLLPPQRAALLASTYPNLPALLRVLNDPTKSVKEREAAVKLAGTGAKAAVLGAQSAKNVFDFFTQTNPNAGCKAGDQ